MIDENLCRNELSPAERASQTARRKAIYLELHPETAHGGDRKSDQVDNLSTRSFAEETASATGKDERPFVAMPSAAVIAKQDEDTQRRLVAEDKLKRAAVELKKAEAEAKEAAKLPKAEPLTTEQKIEKLTEINAREKRYDRMGTSKQEVSNAGFRHFRYFVRFCSFLRGGRVRDRHVIRAEISRPRHSGIGYRLTGWSPLQRRLPGRCRPGNPGAGLSRRRGRLLPFLPARGYAIGRLPPHSSL